MEYDEEANDEFPPTSRLLDDATGSPHLAGTRPHGDPLDAASPSKHPRTKRRYTGERRHRSSSSTASIADQLTSRHSTIAFRVRNLTMNDVVGNLGEPLDFVECKVDNDDGDSDCTGLASGEDMDTEQGNGDIGTSENISATAE